MSDKIWITDVEGGTDRDELKDCFFQPTGPGVYDLYAPDNQTLLATDITSGSSFQFTLDKMVWTIPNPANRAHPFVIDPKEAHGSWIINSATSDGDGETDGESGTFQAQAGGSGDPEEDAAAACG